MQKLKFKATKKQILFLIFIWLGLIFLGSCLPGASVSQFSWVDFSVHKAVHIFEYAVLAFLIMWYLQGSRLMKEKKTLAIFLVVAFCFLYGLSDEFHQSFTPGRQAHIRDALIDLLGGLMGIITFGKSLGKSGLDRVVPHIRSKTELS